MSVKTTLLVALTGRQAKAFSLTGAIQASDPTKYTTDTGGKSTVQPLAVSLLNPPGQNDPFLVALQGAFPDWTFNTANLVGGFEVGSNLPAGYPDPNGLLTDNSFTKTVGSQFILSYNQNQADPSPSPGAIQPPDSSQLHWIQRVTGYNFPGKQGTPNDFIDVPSGFATPFYDQAPDGQLTNILQFKDLPEKSATQNNTFNAQLFLVGSPDPTKKTATIYNGVSWGWSNTFSPNLVTNWGFETGNFSGWTQSGNTNYTFVDNSDPHSGSYTAFLGPVGSLGFLSQTLATTIGQTYELSYFLKSDGDLPNEFEVLVNGATLSDKKNIPSQPYIEYNPKFTATAASTPLTFGFQNDPGYLELDDVSVTAVASQSAPRSANVAVKAVASQSAPRSANVAVKAVASQPVPSSANVAKKAVASQTVPEPDGVFGILAVLGVGFLFKKEVSSKKQQLKVSPLQLTK